MFNWHVLAAIGCIGLASYGMRVGGFLAAAVLPSGGPVQRFLRLAPGNLFVAFVAAGCLAGGTASMVGSGTALVAMALTRRQWLALAAGAAGAGITAALGG